MDVPVDADTQPGKISENHPLVVLFRATKIWNRAASELEFSAKAVFDRLSQLDNFPRHDSVIDDETWQRISSYRYDCTIMPLVFSLNSIGTSIGRMEDALSRIEGVYRGEMKVKVEDRILRTLEAMRTLESDLRATLPNVEKPKTPYAIRQQSLGHLVSLLEVFLESIVETRRTLSAEVIDEALFNSIVDQEEVLRRMKANAARWRDNPSQKMASNVEEFRSQAIEVASAFRTLKMETMLACDSAGMYFFNRVSPRLTREDIVQQCMAGF